MASLWESTPKRIWEDTKNWLQNHIIAWFLAFFVPGVVGVIATLFIPPTIDFRLAALWGFISGAAGLALLVGGTYVIQSILVFRKQRDEARKLYEPIKELTNIKSGNTIEGKDINVSLMFQQLNSNPTREAERHNILDNVTFDHCNLHGPCLITFEGEWEISDCGFFGIGKIKANIPLQQATEGLGKFVHCRFRFCNFHNMSFYLTEKDMAEFSKIRKP